MFEGKANLGVVLKKVNLLAIVPECILSYVGWTVTAATAANSR